MRLHSFTPGGIVTRFGGKRIREDGRPEVVVHITMTDAEITERVIRELQRRKRRNGGVDL